MAQFIPKRNDIVWLDFEPTKGKEIGKYRPALVLSSQEYNQQTGLLICCPISTSIRGGVTEVPVNNLEQPSVVAASLIQTLSWKDRSVKKITTAEKGVMNDVLLRIIPLIGADTLLDDWIKLTGIKNNSVNFRVSASSITDGCLRYVRDNVNLQAGIETGEILRFTAGKFELPDKNMNGQEALKVVAPNTDQTLVKAIEAIKQHESIIPIDCIYREFDTDDLSQPRNKPIRVTTTSISVNIAVISLTNSWNDLTNRKYLRRLYTTESHAGIKHVFMCWLLSVRIRLYK